MNAVTHTLARFAAELAFDALPAEVVARTRMLVTDQVGIALRARHEAPLEASMSAALAALGLGEGSATVIGDPRGYAPPAAALFNGNLGHSLDFDDTHASSSLHPSAPIAPAALAAAEMCGANGRELVAAIVAGYEIQIRLSIALDPSAHYGRGFHPTATCGVFGAAAAAGRIFGLKAGQMESAFGLCASLAAGSMQFLVDGSWNKPFHTGYAAMNGLVAACMAREGFQGARGAIEGRAGFLQGYAPDASPAKAVEGLGETWETLRIAVKPYPSCRYGHAALDALIALRAEHAIDPRDIESVEVGLPRTGWNLIGDPEASKHAPGSVVDGQFSMPFVAAVALRDGAMGWDSYARHIADTDTLALVRRIHTVVDARADADFPAYMAGAVRIRTGNGEFEHYVAVAKGEPENFLSIEELRAKFDDLTGPYFTPARREEIADAWLALDGAEDAGALLRLTRPVGDAGLRLSAAGSGD